jgi:adenine-specific DNA-methyltransferase
MNEQIEQLKATFHKIFQTDQAELDFGIYRIMRQKREEFDVYLETQLLTDLRQSFRKWQTQTGEDLQRQLTEAVNGAIQLGFDPDASPKVKELRETLEAIKHRESLEEGVLSDLVQFLGRYYKEGDFLSLPRYRKNSYAIEYNGEEVKLHWANADQYYVKTAERFRDYRFLLPEGRAVHFKITAANTETGNNKAETGKERRFQLIESEFMREENGELLIFFRYEADAEKRKQAEINAETARRTLQEADGFLEWRKALGELAPTEANKDRTLLDKHLAEYTARNTFDYFIHKDLDAFLRRELDFYIKNEIVRLDDIENEDAPRVELYLAKVKALRRVGHKLISFLAQVENFQKKLFLKKKFVIRANYCVTLDRVPRELWADVLANEAQLAEWQQLYAIDEIEGDLLNGNGERDERFLEANQNLIVDTRHFTEEWKLKLLASFDDLDKELDGTLIKADNFHALNLLQERYRESVKCIYIDPPYNTGGDGFMYKDGYQHSSWLTMIDDRLNECYQLLSQDGVFYGSIGDNEESRFKVLLDNTFSVERFLGLVVWKARVKPINIGESKYRPQKETEYVLAYEKQESAASFQPLLTGSIRTYPHEFNGRKYRIATILKSNRGANYRSTMRFDIDGYTPPKISVGKVEKILFNTCLIITT